MHLSPGSAIYGKAVLTGYDAFVLGFSSRWVWRAPAALMLAHYDANVSTRHLDIGVGTGFFLDRCAFPGPPSLAILDENPNSLEVATKRLERYTPRVFRANFLDDLPADLGTYDSIGLNFVLHCVPGPMDAKGALIARLGQVLRPNGRIFGTTILGYGAAHNILGRRLLAMYNSCGVFDNALDDGQSLEMQLGTRFSQHTIDVRGTVAFFSAKW